MQCHITNHQWRKLVLGNPAECVMHLSIYHFYGWRQWAPECLGSEAPMEMGAYVCGCMVLREGFALVYRSPAVDRGRE